MKLTKKNHTSKKTKAGANPSFHAEPNNES